MKPPTVLKRSLRYLAALLGYRHILMGIAVAVCLLNSLLLAGCGADASGLVSIYLVASTYSGSTSDTSTTNSTTASLFTQAAQGGQAQARVGYFGLCAKRSADGDWICASNAAEISNAFAMLGKVNDPLNILAATQLLKTDVVFPGLLIGVMVFAIAAFVLLSTFPGWHKDVDDETGEEIEVKPFPSRSTLYMTLFVMCIAFLFQMIGALWQHVASASAVLLLENLSQGVVHGHIGATATALVWTGVFLLAVLTAGQWMMVWSISVLDHLTDES